jgi:DNA-binding transcriptional MerR regulator
LTKSTYRVRQFAELTGVTVKALYHYDRLGLLKPARTDAGYRVYEQTDLARLEHIIALRSLGIPLKQMASLLGRDTLPLRSAFKRQREILEDQRRRLDHAIAVLVDAERSVSSGTVPPARALEKLMRILAMQNIDVMRKYFSDEAWPAGRSHFADWPTPEWQALFRAAHAALGSDPAGVTAQALADRWLALSLVESAGPGMRTGLRRAWVDREQWPPALRRRVAEFGVELASRFVGEALWVRWEAERQAQAQAGTSAPPRVSERRRVLFRDCAAILDEPPTSPAARSIAARWQAIVEDEYSGDTPTWAAMLKAFRARNSWPAGLQRYWASLYDLDVSTWQRVADFIERVATINGPSTLQSPSDSSGHPPTESSARRP